MSAPMVELRATYREWWWESEEPDTDVSQDDGYTSVSNPWGGFHTEDPQPELVTLIDAARIVVDFPGSVWDYRDDCDPEQDYKTGHYTIVTLHIESCELAVFGLADMIARGVPLDA